MELIRFALSFALGTFISRILGFLRDASVAYFFGASHVSDAFFVAFRIPNSLRRLLGEGGFNAAFVPLYTRAVESGRDADFLGRVFSFYLALNMLVTLTGVLLSEYIVSVLAPGLRSGDSFSLAVFMARFLFLYLILVGLNALFMGVLNVRGRFFVPAVSQGVFNAVFLLVLLFSADRLGYVALIAGVLLGGIFQVLVNVPFLLRSGVRLKLSFGLDENVKLLLKRLLPALGGFGVNQLSVFIDTFLASFLKAGAISYLYYANRLYQLPFGIVSVGIANSLLSVLSKEGADKEKETTRAFRLVLILMMPASAGLILLSQEIVDLVYRRGLFSVQDAQTTSAVLSIYSVGLVAFSLQKVLSAEFFSRGDTKTPVKASLLTVLSEGTFASIIAFGLGAGIYGLPSGTVLSSIVGLGFLLRKKEVGIVWGELFETFLKVCLATLSMGGAVLVLKNFASGTLAVLYSVPTAVVVYFAVLFVLREGLTLGLLKSLVKKLRNPRGSS